MRWWEHRGLSDGEFYARCYPQTFKRMIPSIVPTTRWESKLIIPFYRWGY